MKETPAQSEGEREYFPAISRGVLALCLLISLAGIGNHDLWTPDEPREAALALGMQRIGDWLIPQLAGEPFVEKPPLFYIVASFFISGFGSALGNTAALRLSSAFWGLGTLLMTYLLGRRLWNRRGGVLALLVLATMPGFVHVSHWLLVDNALMFFVTAACWGLTEAYLGQRFGFLAFAGICAGGAFLAKGLVGPALIAVGGIGLFWPWLRRRGWGELLTGRSLAWHGLALLFLAVLAGGWMLALRRYGGPELWREWFWNNHFGRFTGQAVQLGHRNWAGYYLAVLPLYILPWLAAWLIGLGGAARRLWRKESPGLDWTFLLWWGLGGLLLLTLSSTKREIYLAPLLPAFALMAVPALREPVSAGVRWAGKIWTWLVLAALALLIVAPVLGVGLGVPAKERHLYALVALGFSAIAGIAFFQRNQPWLRTLLLITALGYIAALSILAPLADRVKSYGPAFRQLARQVQAAPAARVAAWQFDETSRAGFNYYCGLVFPAVSNTNELAAILAGTHPRFDGVLCVSSSSKKFPPAGVALPDWRVAGEVSMGKNRRLQWIVGQRLYLPDPKIPRGETE